MDLTLLGRGLVLGFTIAAAVGPHHPDASARTVGEGRVVGLASGLGVAPPTPHTGRSQHSG